MTAARPGVGLMLAPDVVFIDLLAPVLRGTAVDYFGVTPETTWTFAGGRFEPNGFVGAFERIAAGRPFVAHGVGLSLGSELPAQRHAWWLDAIARDHRRWDFGWYTDHLGGHVFGDRDVSLPLPLPWDARRLRRTADGLRALAERVPVVGVENSAFYYSVDAPVDEPVFLSQVCDAAQAHVLLDLHNLYTNAVNLGFSPHAWLARLPLDRVLEIHVAGGVLDPMGSGLRMDSHDAPVPDSVWTLLADVVGRCPNLRGVTLERREDTVEADDVPVLEAELHRIRAILDEAGRANVGDSEPFGPPPAHDDQYTASAIVSALLADDPVAGLEAEAHRMPAAVLDRLRTPGFVLTAQLIVRLRFERLLNGSPEAAAHFERDPRDFSQLFRAYHANVPPTAAFPQDEAALFAAFTAPRGRD